MQWENWEVKVKNPDTLKAACYTGDTLGIYLITREGSIDTA